jgi:hypothetical protein
MSWKYTNKVTFFGNYFTVFWEFNPETNEYCNFQDQISAYINQEI